jgi:hypothetical protein
MTMRLATAALIVIGCLNVAVSFVAYELSRAADAGLAAAGRDPVQVQETQSVPVDLSEIAAGLAQLHENIRVLSTVTGAASVVSACVANGRTLTDLDGGTASLKILDECTAAWVTVNSH